MYLIPNTHIKAKTARDCAVLFFKTEAVVQFPDGCWMNMVDGRMVRVEAR